MKTFKTEKHNIPEGATHYLDETYDNFFYWGMRYDGRFKLMDTNSKEWLDVNSETFNLNCKPIPQTNVETPEEKEALDLIDTTPHQYEMSKFSGKAKWKNGDDVEAYGKPYKYVGLDPFNDNLCICLANQDDDPQCFSVDEIKKPESPQQREERERLEAAEDLYITYMSKWEFAQDWRALDEINKSAFLAIVDKTNYRKDS